MSCSQVGVGVVALDGRRSFSWHTAPPYYSAPSPKSGCLYMYVCMYVCKIVNIKPTFVFL